MRQINQALVGLRAEQLDLQHRQTQPQFILQNLQQSDNLAKREKLEQANSGWSRRKKRRRPVPGRGVSASRFQSLSSCYPRWTRRRRPFETMASTGHGRPGSRPAVLARLRLPV